MAEQSARFLDLLVGCTPDESSRRGSGNAVFTTEFLGGLRATLSLTEKNRWVYTDNSRMELWRCTLRSPRL